MQLLDNEYRGVSQIGRGTQMREEFREKFRVLGLKIAYSENCAA